MKVGRMEGGRKKRKEEKKNKEGEKEKGRKEKKILEVHRKHLEAHLGLLNN